jgi:hypothetical protein
MPLTVETITSTQLSDTITLPAHQAGDLILMSGCATFATTMAPDAGGSVPTWNLITSGSASYYSEIRYAVATSSSHTSGTWNGAIYGALIAVVLRGQKSSSPIGGAAYNSSATDTSSPSAPAITLTNTSGSSKILHFYVPVVTTNRTFNAAPAGYTSLLSVDPTTAAYGRRCLSKDVTTSDGAIAQGLSGNCVDYWVASVEVLAAPATPAFFAMF